jgi:hypothetical protein
MVGGRSSVRAIPRIPVFVVLFLFDGLLSREGRFYFTAGIFHWTVGVSILTVGVESNEGSPRIAFCMCLALGVCLVGWLQT